MKYFNGFSLQNEECLFKEYLTDDAFTVAGFSYGAQQAFEYAYTNNKRIDRLILLSPAFFQTQKASFVRTQLRYFEAGQEAYVKHFLENISYPSNVNLAPYLNIGTKDELDALLSYVWEEEKIQTLLDKGTTIEVFLGEEDKIINVKDTHAFFRKQCITYSMKNCGHILKGQA